MLAPFKARRKGTPQTAQSVGIPAPTRGIIASTAYNHAMGESGLDSALYIYNMIAGEFGCRVRQGSREFAINIADKTDQPGEVRTLLYYNSVQQGGGQDKFFAVTDKGIYDITAGGDFTGVAPVLEWPNQSDDAGWCSFVNYTNVGGAHYLLVCDEANGYYIFDGTTWAQGAWTGPGTSNPAVEDMVHITEWQGRLWFTERNSDRAWYLNVLEFNNTDPKSIDFGSRFIYGGHLVMCSTWTLDAGDGMDDKLVVISSAGDVLVLGSNVQLASDAFIVEGRWQVGKVPEGRRVMSEEGGDIQILTETGLVRLSDVLRGLIIAQSEKYVTHNIASYIREAMLDAVDLYGWSVSKNSAEGIMIVTVPRTFLQMNQPAVQLVMDINTNSWSIFRGLDMVCTNENNEGFFFGTTDGRAMKMAGTVDEAKLDGESSQGIKFSLLTHYSNFGAPANWKQVQFVRPWWLGDADPAYMTKVMYDFSFAEIEGAPVFTGANIAIWDSAIWDIDKWVVTAQNYWETVGAKGMGRHIALAIKGETSVNTTYLGCDLMLNQGGML